MKKLSTLVLVATLFITQPAFAFKFFSGGLDCPVLPHITKGFLANHVQVRELDPSIELRTVDQFIKRLDPSKLYLLESDVAEIRESFKDIFSKLGNDCSAIEKSQKILTNRLSEAFVFVKKSLGKDFKFQENTELTIDPQLRKTPKDKKEAEELLGKFLQFQISNYLATDMKLEQAKKQLIHRYELALARQKKQKKDEVHSMFLDSFASSLDSHSSYLSQETLEDFEIQMRLSLEGIGAALSWEDGYTTIDNLIPGGSAERSGELQPKDKIIAVAQGEKGSFESVIDLQLRDVVKLIRGKKDTIVRLTVLREEGGEAKRLIVSLKRDKINLQDEAAKLTYTTRKIGDKSQKIAVIDLPSFYGDMSRKTRSSYEDLKKLVDQAVREKADGIVLDLSTNAGGLLSEAVRITGLFISKGNVVATKGPNQKLDALDDDDDKIAYSGPLVVLTSRLSASASEIVSGALQDYKRALIVGGDHTFGKGTVQAMMNLPAGLGAIKVTTGMFYVPSGNSTQMRGIPADIVLPSVFSTKDMGEVSLDYALPAHKVDPFLSPEATQKLASTVSSELIAKLRAKSEARVSKDPEFKKIKDEVAEFEKKKGVVKLSDSLKKQKEENIKEKKEKKVAKKSRRRQSDEDYLKTPQVKEAVDILGDWLELNASNSTFARTGA